MKVPGLFTSQDCCSNKEAAHEAVDITTANGLQRC